MSSPARRLRLFSVRCTAVSPTVGACRVSSACPRATRARTRTAHTGWPAPRRSRRGRGPLSLSVLTIILCTLRFVRTQCRMCNDFFLYYSIILIFQFDCDTLSAETQKSKMHAKLVDSGGVDRFRITHFQQKPSRADTRHGVLGTTDATPHPPPDTDQHIAP